MWSDIHETWEIMVGGMPHRIAVHNRGELFRDMLEIMLDERKVLSHRIRHADLEGNHILQVDGQTLNVYWKFNKSTGKPISIVLMHGDRIVAYYGNTEAAPIASSTPSPAATPDHAGDVVFSAVEMAEKSKAAIVQGFNLDELKSLCFELGIIFDNLAGDTLDAKARELVAYSQRRGELAKLFAAIRVRRLLLSLPAQRLKSQAT